MDVLGMGLNLKGERLYPVIGARDMADALRDRLLPNGARIRGMSAATSHGVEFRGEQKRRVVDVGDPKAVGWTFLVAESDPHKGAITEALAPLIQARGMADPSKPLLFAGTRPEDWHQWLTERYTALGLTNQQVPAYVLIVGGPDRVPFGFQSLFDQAASVGRVDFATIDDLAAYAAKVVRLESAPEPVVAREALFFATDAGLEDPTYFSRRYMAEPLAAHVRDVHKLKTTEIFGDQATKATLLDALRTSRPALVYTASHGLGATSESQAVQERYNGAICCHANGRLTPDQLFAGDDVPGDGAFLEGAVFFQFACFGYGTPVQSEYAHWFPETWQKPQRLADRDFIAALPRRLLAHPRGPIAFMGHLDTAFLHGFADPSEPHTLDRWHARIAPFKKAVDQLLGVQPTGLAMEGINERYALCNALLASSYDRVQKGTMTWTDESLASLLDTWITRGDAQNYMMFGDPAASLRLPS